MKPAFKKKRTKQHEGKMKTYKIIVSQLSHFNFHCYPPLALFP